MSSENKSASKLVIFLVVFVDLFGFGIMIPMLPFFVRSLHHTAEDAGTLMTVYSLMQILVSPLWGQLSDRFGRRPILLLTILGQAFAFLWAGLSNSYESLLMSRVLAGAFAANISTASAYMADITKPEDRAKGMGLIGAAFGMGFVFGPAVGGFLVKYGFQWPSLVAAAIGLLNFGWALFVLKEPAANAEARRGNRRRFSWRDLKATISQKRFRIPIIVFFLLTLAFVQLEITFGYFVVDRFQLLEGQAGYLLAFLGIVMAIVQGGVIGRLSKRFEELRLVLTGTIFIVLGLATMVFSFHLWVLLGALMILAVGYSLTNPCLSALISKAAPPEQQGSILGIYQSGSSLARVLGPLLAGVMYDTRMILPFVSAIAIVMLASFIVLGRLFSHKNPSEI